MSNIKQDNMDAKNIFIACNYMKMKIQWENESDNEWRFVGEGNDFKEQEVSEFIQSFFVESNIYFIIDRNNSCLISLQEAPKKIQKWLKDKNIILCDVSFKKMVEFNYIGVARHGKIK